MACRGPRASPGSQRRAPWTGFGGQRRAGWAFPQPRSAFHTPPGQTKELQSLEVHPPAANPNPRLAASGSESPQGEGTLRRRFSGSISSSRRAVVRPPAPPRASTLCVEETRRRSNGPNRRVSRRERAVEKVVDFDAGDGRADRGPQGPVPRSQTGVSGPPRDGAGGDERDCCNSELGLARAPSAGDAPIPRRRPATPRAAWRSTNARLVVSPYASTSWSSSTRIYALLDAHNAREARPRPPRPRTVGWSPRPCSARSGPRSSPLRSACPSPPPSAASTRRVAAESPMGRF